MFVGLLVFAAVVVAAIWLVGVYNKLVATKHSVAQAWANIDVLLKQRHDELPKLVDICKAYVKYEQGALERVLRARASLMAARDGGGSLGPAESELRRALGGLFAVAEGYPDLKASGPYLQLQGRISELESSIADRRGFYNDS